MAKAMKAAAIMEWVRAMERSGELYLPTGGVNTRALLYFLADYVAIARLQNGERLLDATDFVAWLRELGDAAQASQAEEDSVSACPQVMKRMPTHDFVARHFIDPRGERCPRCGHIHQGVVQCGCDLGGGRICRCELPVPA